MTIHQFLGKVKKEAKRAGDKGMVGVEASLMDYTSVGVEAEFHIYSATAKKYFKGKSPGVCLEQYRGFFVSRREPKTPQDMQVT